MDNHSNERVLFKDYEVNMRAVKKFLFSVPIGVALHRVILDQNEKPIDYVILEVNKTFEYWTGLHRDDILNRRITEVLPGIENDESDWIGKYGNIAITGESKIFTSYSEQLEKWYRVTATCPHIGYFITIFEDVTDRKRLEKEREELIIKLQTPFPK